MNNIPYEQIKKNLANIPFGKALETSAEKTKTLRPFEKNGKCKIESHRLYSGITLSFSEYLADETSHSHDCDDNFLEINYCTGGRAGWQTNDKKTIYLGPGDFAVHTKQLCASSVITFPNGYYSGITIFINTKEANQGAPELVFEAGISLKALMQKLCPDGGFTTITGNEKNAFLFDGFLNVPPNLRLPYFKLKAQEIIFFLFMLEADKKNKTSGYAPDQIELIKKIHSKLIENLDKRITIEELAASYPINPSSVKKLFKAVYGNSIAAHIKEHRMEKAAFLLQKSGKSISEIAFLVGYDNQSKFSSEFKKIYNMLPSEYKKLHS